MSQIITVKTDIRNFKSLESAAKGLGYTVSGNEAKIEMSRNYTRFTAQKKGDSYEIVGDSDYLGRGSKDAITELRNEYAKEEALAWAKFTGRTVLSVTGNATKGYDVEISA